LKRGGKRGIAPTSSLHNCPCNFLWGGKKKRGRKGNERGGGKGSHFFFPIPLREDLKFGRKKVGRGDE